MRPIAQILDVKGGNDYSFYYAFQAGLDSNSIGGVCMEYYDKPFALGMLSKAVKFASGNHAEMKGMLVIHNQTFVDTLVSFCSHYDHNANFTRHRYVPSEGLIQTMKENATAYTAKPEDGQWKRLVDSYGNYAKGCDPHANEITQTMIAACYNVQFRFYCQKDEGVPRLHYKIGNPGAQVIAIFCNPAHGAVYKAMLMSVKDLERLGTDDTCCIKIVKDINDPPMRMCQQCWKPIPPQI